MSVRGEVASMPERAERGIERVRRELSAAESQVGELRSVEAERDTLRVEIQRLRAELETLAAEQERRAGEISRLEAGLATSQREAEVLAGRMREDFERRLEAVRRAQGGSVTTTQLLPAPAQVR